MPTFFVPSEAVTPPLVRISGPLLRHLKDSLRLAPGDPLTVTDDHGRRYQTLVVTVTDRFLESRIVRSTQAPPRSNPSLVLVQALLKGEKMDWVIQKATELGVSAIVLLNTRHGVVKIRQDRLEHQRSRWQRIALEAAQQSERWTVPSVSAPADLAEVVASYPSAVRFVLAERSAETPLTAVPLPRGVDDTVLLAVGPEGGWHDDELRIMRERGYRTLTLGPTILRAETAALAALSIVQSRLGVLG
jgi:16S rRNA (uracil1498-N3)-methyltransferase